MYAGFLAIADELIDDLEDHGAVAARELKIRREKGMGLGAYVVHPFDWHGLNVLTGKIDLVAPRHVATATSAMSVAIFDTASTEPAHENTDEIDIDVLDVQLKNLREIMRRDHAPRETEA